MYTQTTYCMDAQCDTTTFALTYYTQSSRDQSRIPLHCPFCGGTNLMNEATHERLAFIKTLARDGVTLTETAYDKLLTRFHSQSAFTDFRQYVGCILFDDHPAAPITRPNPNDMGDTGTPLKYKDGQAKLNSQRTMQHA
jgi:hypothetical protein